MKKLLPILLLLLGLGAGTGAGWFLRPHPVPPDTVASTEHGVTPAAEAAEGHGERSTGYEPAPAETEVVRLPNQFVVPLIQDGQVRAMVVIGLALELTPGHRFEISRDGPRLQAVLLQLLFDHANIGGFDGLFTSGEVLLALRRTLREAVRAEIGPHLHDVLITDLLRQES